MDYPAPVQARIDKLDKYEVNNSLQEFDVLHMYPGELAYPGGYHDARWFKLWGFNTMTMEKKDLGRHDGMIALNYAVPIQASGIYADGSTYINLTRPIRIIQGQAVYLYEERGKVSKQS